MYQGAQTVEEIRAKALQKQKDDIADLLANPNRRPRKGSVFASRTNEHNKIDVAIIDFGQPRTYEFNLKKKKALMKSLFEMMYKDLMSEADISPKFSGSSVVGDTLRIIAVDVRSAEYMKDLVARMPPPWPHAQLVAQYRSPQRVVVEAYVPGEMVLIDDIFERIGRYDRRFNMTYWKAIGGRPHGEGYVYTITIDLENFQFLEKHNGFVPWTNGAQIEFRVLNTNYQTQDGM